MEDDDEEIYRETENSDSDFSDEDYQITPIILQKGTFLSFQF